MKYLIWLLRIVLGGLFIFSGVVKANDPLGLTYKMNEFFDVLHLEFLQKHSFFFSVSMITFEITAGVAIIVGNAFRFWSVLMLLLNAFFTFLTWYAWKSGKIHECGCFGNCFKLANDVTFYKDVVLTAIALFLWIFRYRVFPIFDKDGTNMGIVGGAFVIAVAGQWYTLHHLPIHDCLPYKVGNNLWEKMQPAPDAVPDEYETILTYSKNGIKKEFTTQEYMDKKIWEDKAWKFDTSITKLVKEGKGQPEIPKDFALTTLKGADSTERVLKAEGYTFLWFIREPEKADLKDMDKLHNIIDKANAMHVRFYVCISATPDQCKTYKEVWNMKDVQFFLIDGVVCKTAMRTNPGLMLLKDGVVQNKWSYLDYPKDIVLDNGVLSIK